MVASPKKIVLSGYYGFRNSGDEAVLQSILNALRRQSEAAGVLVEPIVLSIDPAWTSSTYGVRAVHRMKLSEVRKAIAESDGLISGGGSLLQDVTSPKSVPYYLGVIKLAQWMGKPTFVYAQGVGPVQRKLFHYMIKSVFQKCSYISVRDEQSRDLLLSMGIKRPAIEVVPDPVMGLSVPRAGTTDEASRTGSTETAGKAVLPVIGVSVRFWEQDRKELDAIAEGLRQVCLALPVHIRFLPFHLPADAEASRYCMDKIGNVQDSGSAVSICEGTEHPYEMLREVEACQALLGMRLHSLIYAAGQRVPLLGVSYDPKIDHFLSRIDSVPAGRTGSLDSGAVSEQLLRLLRDGESWRRQREPLIASLVQEAEAPARHIIDDFRHKG
ncbi:polysaccharide pyruvyl transferase CsaB [Paenibacillus sp. HN-1]|uniref:polysaccharide pyruvyl transferase CsaB n=1 Tax=Paenibacillus TaxID=44249 RepID=UPI001CA877D4|nr:MULTISPECIES: polysaccharide pyruvyl transferase CsaB [Paenibacillus]MBY9077629.1 polysaccharide pyruvyl transferase CsaB [Paenibacillus sp. CGMCC 1.18879]MBY9087446.1 polysaccharide pyruvyl transferase CsaB [Paenibacillus sinensis]